MGTGETCLALPGVVLARYGFFDPAGILLHRRAHLLGAFLDGDPGGPGLALYGGSRRFGAARDGVACFLGIPLDDSRSFLGVPFDLGTYVPGILFE
jgi:hypothetical protein